MINVNLNVLLYLNFKLHVKLYEKEFIATSLRKWKRADLPSFILLSGARFLCRQNRAVMTT